jgi:hypothetical protein
MRFPHPTDYRTNMAVLSVDLAYRRWSDLGVVILDRVQVEKGAKMSANFVISCEIIPFSAPPEGPGPVNANVLAGQLNHMCAARDIHVIMLDGPQAWKSNANGIDHCRVSERQLNTSAKTGLPGMVKPVTYRAFAEWSLDVFDALSRRGWRRLATMGQPGNQPERILVESYPHAAWKSLGLKPLPSKRRARVSDLAEAFAALRSLIPFKTNRPPNHDQLQAIVGGLAGLALEDRTAGDTRIVGKPPRREDGHWREGFIVLPVAPNRAGTRVLLDRLRSRE